MGGRSVIQNQESHMPSEINNPSCRARILYMEDDFGLSSLLKRNLERMACAVDLARDGQEGLKMFAAITYDVVIADYDMPIVNGLEVLGKLKDLVPVIILTGQGDEMVAVTAMKFGAADYVTKDANGKYLEILPSIIDRVLERQQLIMDRRQARAELQASETRYRAIVEDQTELICRFDHSGSVTFANGAFCRYFGILRADIKFQNFATILSRKTYQHIKLVLKTLTRQNLSVVDTIEIKMPDGKVHWLQWTNRAIFDDADKFKEYQIVGRDITELKEVEEALRVSEENNSAFLDAIPYSILRINQHGICVDLRFKAGQVLALSLDLIGKNIAEFFAPDVVILMMEYTKKALMEGERTSQVFQFTSRQAAGVSEQEARLIFAGGNEVLIILRDITEVGRSR
jgi:PAS domain S-box-containing protein